MDQEEVRRNLRKSLDEYERYVHSARKRTLAYQPATVVWETLLRDPAINGIVAGSLSQPAVLKTKLQNALEFLDQPDALIDRIDEQKRHNSKRKRIVASARHSLLNGIAEITDRLSGLSRSVELAENWTATSGIRPDESRRGNLFRRLCHAAAEALHSNEAKVDGSPDSLDAACCTAASRIIGAQAGALETGQFTNPFTDAFRFDRYRLPPPARRPDEAPDGVLGALRKFVSSPHSGWLRVFEAAIESDDHLATGAILPLARQEAAPRDLELERRDAIERARLQLGKFRAEVLQDLVRAMNYATAGDTELDALRIEIEGLNPNTLPLDNIPGEAGDVSVAPANVVMDFPAAKERIDGARRAVETIERKAISEACGRILRLKESEAPETIEYLNDLVRRSDLITLMEELPLIERGQPVSFDSARTNPLELFTENLRRIEKGEDDAAHRLRELASGRQIIEPRAVNLARAWGQIIDVRKGNPAQYVKNLLSELGFVIHGEIEEAGPPTRFLRSLRVRTRRLSDRDTCAVARFGSEANGRYQIVIAEKDAKAVEIIEAIPTSPTGATLLFIKNALGVQERVELARLARQKDRAFCLVDTELILFLAGRDNPLGDFFACGIPFGSASPFALQPGSIPVEVFFGREQEMRSVYEPDGSCIVYGGRQLGKSVMLDHIAKTQDVSGRLIVRRIDCQAILNQTADVWRIIANTLREAGLDQFASLRSSDQVSHAIRDWLDEDAERRLLLMLDETNEFVLRDAEKGFLELVALRGLMENTGRRFKVVLSGQHNVLRMTHNPNTPLAHFGQPVVIGPLRGSDLRAARQLVTEPLAAVGYVFSDRGLVSRILAETQYYPKLIQILCQNLLRHMRRQSSTDGRHKDSPPWTIHPEDLTAVLRNNDIRQEIFNTFQITLQLDKRYELISLIFADKLYDRKSGHDSRVGFSVQELMGEAFRFWPNGFPASNKREVFHALLDELVGLGILIENSSSGRYRLASPIIGSMIGTAEEVEHRLLAFESEGLPPEIEPERRRMPIDAREAWPNLSPLVPAQVSRLLAPRTAKPSPEGSRISIVFGSPAMRLDRIAAALQPPPTYDGPVAIVRTTRVHTERAAFVREIVATRGEGQRCVVIPPETPWEPSWVRETLEAKTRTRFVFVGDASHAWRCHVEEAGSLPLGKLIPTETLAPLSLAEIEDQLRRNATWTDSPRILADRIHRTTGGFLVPFANILKSEPVQALERFAGADLNPLDFGVPIIPAARAATSAMLTYISPSEHLRITDLQSIERDTGVDGGLLRDWLIAAGLAELGSSAVEQLDDDGGLIRLNPILQHRAVLRSLLVAD
jgi:hypothetical protein